MAPRSFPLLLAVSLAACSGSGGDGLSNALGSAGRDAGADAGRGDGGSKELDAGTEELDAAEPADAAAAPSADAGDMDADLGSDAAQDAGETDAAVDAGELDAGVDAGTPIDAGLGCLAPTDDTPLTPAAAGVPANGLLLWLRADHGVYKTASADVCGWLNAAGAGELFQGSATARPTWDPIALSEQPAIRFRAGQVLTIANVMGLAPQAARTFVAVQKLSNTTARFFALSQGLGGSPGTYVGLDTNTFNTAGSREGVYVTNNSFDSALATSTATRLHVLAVDAMTVGTPVLPALHYRVNGVPMTMTLNRGGTGNFQSFDTANFTAVGSALGAADVWLSELLAYDHALTAPELAALEDALLNRYAIQP
jgi:hypothetical protein